MNRKTCTATNRQHQPCKHPAAPGSDRCRYHIGIPMYRQRANTKVREEIMRWGLDPTRPDVDPGQTLLALVAQSKQRVDFYAALLEEAYAAAERVRQAAIAGDLLVSEPRAEWVDDPSGEGGAFEVEDPAVAAARLDLDRVFATGGVGVLIGSKKGVDRSGRVFDESEAIRGLALLEAEERDRLARFCKLALDAGIAERQVRLAEQQGALVANVIRAVLGDLRLTPEQAALVSTVVPARLRELSASVVPSAQ